MEPVLERGGAADQPTQEAVVSGVGILYAVRGKTSVQSELSVLARDRRNRQTRCRQPRASDLNEKSFHGIGHTGVQVGNPSRDEIASRQCVKR